MTDTQTTDAIRDLATYHQRRELAAVQPRGNLALVNTQWIDAEQTIWGIPGRWAPAAKGLTVFATYDDGIVVDGVQVEDEALVLGSDSDTPSDLRFNDTTTGTVIRNAAGEYGLRVWDANSEAIQEFGSISIFPYNPEWVITAAWKELPEATTMGFEHLKDEGSTRDEVIPGEITFSKDGVDYNLAAFKAGRALQLVFSDATNGDSTYSVGRFLYLAPNADGTITLDFNRAVLPPCAFSYLYNCPLPPKQNRFAVPIEAGEKMVLKQDGTPLHPE
jgi:uncharacterized protein (DUF1684 family)